MSPSARKVMLTVHVTSSVGWFGALAVFLAHAVASLVSQDDRIVVAASVAMGLTAWFVIVPLSLTSLITGLIQALGTAWGLLRHYWILFKLLLASLATIVLFLKLQPINYLADAPATATFASSDLIGLRTSLVIHAAGGLLVLFSAIVLAVCKPAGLTPFGAGKLEKGSCATPRWAKVCAAVLGVLLLVLAIMVVVGGHGPGAHPPGRGH
jgi:hypothetical protein